MELLAIGRVMLLQSLGGNFMQTVNVLFQSYREAQNALNALVKHGIDNHDISLLTHSKTDEVKRQLSSYKNGRGIAMGAAAGIGVGTLAGLAALAIPGFGEVEITGWLAAMLGGALTGGALGAAAGNMAEVMRKAGINEHEAQFFVEAVQQGAVLLTVRVEDEDVNRIKAILTDFDAINPNISDTTISHRAIVDETNSPYVQAHKKAAREGHSVNHNVF